MLTEMGLLNGLITLSLLVEWENTMQMQCVK